ncbi:MAG TPA: ribosome-associated translation inhibitor RaiA [Vicinamibacterales bacterium]|jgi:putative sigma-54 modulation protein
MRLDITGRHVDITPSLRQLIDKRLSKLDRLLHDRAVSATIILTKEKYRHLTELVIHARGDHMLRGTGQGSDWNLSVRQAEEKVARQAQKLKSKWTERKRKNNGTRAVTEPSPEAPSPRFAVRPSRYPVKPMTIEDAALRVETGREAFVVFRNADTDAVSIVYRRRDGNLGLIEPD